jgi:hypothetical protein
MHPRRCRLPTALSRMRRALAWWIAAWLLTQTLGQLHAVLHARPTAVATAMAVTGVPVAEALGRAFHPRDDPAYPDGGLCRLYSQVAQGDLAAGAEPGFFMDGAFAVPSAAAVASAGASRRRGPEARGPPAFG